METYVDGFVLPIAKDKVDAYARMSNEAGKLWMEYGALAYRELVGDDLEMKDQIPFPELAGAKEGETVIFSYIRYRSREHRDEVNAKVMADPRILEMCTDADKPFDPRRMAWGGFRTIVEHVAEE